MKYIIKTEADWLEIRKKYITASNAAVLVGADPYSSPATLRNPPPFFGNAYTRVGQMLEPVVVNVVNDVLSLSGASRFHLYENAEGHKEFYTEGRLGATPDAHNDYMLLECKTTRPKTFVKYGAVPPSKYLIQLLVQMMCTGIDSGMLAIMSTNLTQESPALIWPIKIFKMWKDVRICDILQLEAERFTDISKMFRVDSKVKQKVKLLLLLSYEEVVC